MYAADHIIVELICGLTLLIAQDRNILKELVNHKKRVGDKCLWQLISTTETLQSILDIRYWWLLFKDYL